MKNEENKKIATTFWNDLKTFGGLFMAQRSWWKEKRTGLLRITPVSSKHSLSPNSKAKTHSFGPLKSESRILSLHFC